MLRNLFRATSFGMLLVVATAAVASADPVVVRRGGFSFDTGDPEFLSLVGDGFNFHFGGFDPISFDWRFPQICVPGPCASGTTLDLSTSLGGITGFVPSGGVAGGVTYPQLFLSGDLSFATGTVTVPPVNAFAARLSTPFTFSGHLRAFTDVQLQQTVFDSDLAGSGRAEILLGAHCATADCDTPSGPFSFVAMSYSFEDVTPTPEPGTLLLTGTGVAVLVRRLRTRRTE